MKTWFMSLCVFSMATAASAYTPKWAKDAYQCKKEVTRVGYRTIEGSCERGFRTSQPNRDRVSCMLKKGWCLPTFHKSK